MKIKITISREELEKQVESYFAKSYSQWVDFACFHNKKAAIKLDVPDLIFNAKLKVFKLKNKEIASLLYSKRFTYIQLHIFVLRYIKDSFLTNHQTSRQNPS